MTEMLKTSETTEKLLKFIDASPSCFHAVKNICVMLEDAGCIRLLENETWTLEKGKRYFIDCATALLFLAFSRAAKL